MYQRKRYCILKPGIAAWSCNALVGCDMTHIRVRDGCLAMLSVTAKLPLAEVAMEPITFAVYSADCPNQLWQSVYPCTAVTAITAAAHDSAHY